MGRKNKEDRRKISPIRVIILVLILFAFAGLILLSTILLNQANVIKEDTKIKIDINDTYLSIIEDYKENNKDLLTTLDIYNNIDENIKIIKDKYFTTIKTFEDQVVEGKVNYKIAYITFDDGPYYNTYNVLNMLDKYDILATFFTTNVNGNHCYDNYNYNCQNLYAEYVKRGHTIANHTYTHDIWGTRTSHGVYNSVSSFIWNINEQEKLISNLTGGYKTNITRFPGGSATAGSLKNGIISELRKLGYGYVDWTAQDGDGGDPGSTTDAYTTFKKSINEQIEVVLFHDYSNITYAILPQVFQYLLDNNYVMLPLFYESRMINK